MLFGGLSCKIEHLFVLVHKMQGSLWWHSTMMFRKFESWWTIRHQDMKTSILTPTYVYVEQTKLSRFCDEPMCSVGIFGSLLHDTISSMPICVTIHRVFWTTKMILIMDFSILVCLHASELTFKGNIKPQLQWRYLAHFRQQNWIEWTLLNTHETMQRALEHRLFARKMYMGDFVSSI